MGAELSNSAIQTVLLGAAVYVSGQIVQRFVVDPIHEQKKIIGEVASVLLFYGNIAHVAEKMPGGGQVQYPEEPAQASRNLRSLASRLRATLWSIPLYWFWAFLRVVPSRKRILKASTGLVGWSNSLYTGQPGVHKKNVVAVLKLPDDE